MRLHYFTPLLRRWPLLGLAALISLVALATLLTGPPLAEAQSVPTLSSGVATGNSLALTFSENLDSNSSPAGSTFTVTATEGGASRNIKGVAVGAISGTGFTVVLQTPVYPNEALKLSYTKPASNPLRAAATGNAEVASFSDQSVSNAEPPVVSSALVNGARLEIGFNGNMAGAANLANSAFTVKVGGSAVSLSGTPSIGNSAVVITLASAVVVDDTVTVSYTKPTSGTNNKLTGTNGADVASFTDQAVVNITPPSGSVAFSDGFIGTDCTNNPGTCPERPTGYAVPGPGPGQITIVWSRNTTGTQRPFNNWRIHNSKSDFSTFPSIVKMSNDKNLSTHTFSNLEAGSTYTVGISIGAGTPIKLLSGIAIARLKPLSIPVVSSASVNGTSLTTTFNENLAAAANLANSAFTVKKTPSGGSETSVSLTGTPSISGKTVTLTLASDVAHTDTGVKVSYAAPASGTNNKLVSPTGGVVVSFTDKSVDNNTPPPPVVSSASVSGTSLTITFDYDLAEAPGLTNSPFTVKKTPPGSTSATTVSLTGPPSISGRAVTLTLASAVEEGDTVMVSYQPGPTEDAENRLRAAGSSGTTSFVANFSDLMVANNTPSPRPPGYSIQCSDYGYWYVEGDISGNPGARSSIACDMAKPGWIFEWNRPGYIKWVYRGDRVVTPYTNPGSDVIRTRLAPIQGGNARPPVNQPLADGTHYDAFTYNADANNRAVRGADGQCYRERRVSGRWQRSTAYRTDPNNYLEACHRASWNAHNRWRNLPLVYPASITLFPIGPGPVPPVFQSAVVDETTLTMTFDENLDRGSVPSHSAFRVTVNNARRNVEAGGVAISGKTVRLTLASAVSDTDTVKVRYSRPAGNPLKGAAFGKAVATFADQAVRPPEPIWSATLTVASLQFTYGCARSSGTCISHLSNDGFTHLGATIRVTDVTRFKTVNIFTVRFDSAVSRDWVLYVGDRRYPIEGATLSEGDRRASWSNPGFTWSENQQVSLRITSSGGSGGSSSAASLASDPIVVPDGPGPTSVESVAVISDAGADQTYGLGDTIHVRVTFVGPVEVDTTGGTPRLKIDMDPADWGEKWAAYASGSGTNSLTFTHTVVEPNYSTQGIAVLENTLELNGGTMQSDGLAALLSHTGLAHDADHKVDWQLSEEGGAGS